MEFYLRIRAQVCGGKMIETDLNKSMHASGADHPSPAAHPNLHFHKGACARFVDVAVVFIDFGR